MSKKIIEHDNQQFMFDGKFTQPIKQEIIIGDLRVNEICQSNVHLVAESIIEKSELTAEQLILELDMQLKFRGK